MNDVFIDLVLWFIASPVYFVLWILRMVRRWRFLRMAYTSAITCRNCGETVSLVGLWRCGCGYTYRGHALRACPVCASIPPMARCYACGVTEKLPEP